MFMSILKYLRSSSVLTSGFLEGRDPPRLARRFKVPFPSCLGTSFGFERDFEGAFGFELGFGAAFDLGFAAVFDCKRFDLVFALGSLGS